MKNSMLVVIVTLTVMVSYATGAEFEIPPVLMRLSRFERTYLQAIDGNKDLVIQTRLRSNSREYIIYWDTRAFKHSPPVWKLGQVLSTERLAEIASNFLRQNLDNDFLNKRLEPISIMQFQHSSKIGRISFFEYLVHDKSPTAGSGFGPTVVVPLTSDGKILCKITSGY